MYSLDSTTAMLRVGRFLIKVSENNYNQDYLIIINIININQLEDYLMIMISQSLKNKFDYLTRKSFKPSH